MRFIQTASAQMDENMKAEYAAFGLGPMAAQLLYARGILPEQTAAYLSPTEKDLQDPFLFLHMEAVVARIKMAAAEKEQVTIYGDYDCDGVCAAATLKMALAEVGITADIYLPDRKTEGYGTNKGAFERIIDAGNTLIITVDCGIRSNEDVAYAKSRGVDVVIMDHHECDVLPDTPYILNPKMPGERYPYKELCGAGVVFKVAQALLGEEALPYLDITGLATIGDMVPLTGENRVIAACGIKRMQQAQRIGIACLAKAARLDIKKINAGNISFGLVPRINAAGRLAHANIAVMLLLAEDEPTAARLAGELCMLNTKRQSMQQEMTQQAIEMIEQNVNLAQTRILCIASTDWDKGVVGLIASSLVQRFSRPAVVFAEEDTILVGSARSIPGVNIYEALAACEARFIRFGGHEMAAGLSIEKKELEAIAEEANQYLLATYEDEAFLPTVFYDEKASANAIDLTLIEQLSKMEPFGQENPEPVFWIPDYKVRSVQKLGEGNHLKLLGDGAEVLWFRATQEVQQSSCWDIAANVSINEFRGIKSPQIIVRNMQETQVGIVQMAKRMSAAYLQAFHKEILAYYELKKQIKEIDAPTVFTDSVIIHLQEAEKNSLFGTLVSIGSVAGAQVMENAQYPKSFQLKQSPEKESAQNLISFSPGMIATKNYPNIYLVGDCLKAAYLKNAKIYWGEDLHTAYWDWAKQYYVEETQLLVYCEQLYNSGRSGFMQMRQVLSQTAKDMGDTTMGKSWFALQVLLEQQLLTIEKNDRIYSISKLEADERSGSSTLFTAVKEIVYKEV